LSECKGITIFQTLGNGYSKKGRVIVCQRVPNVASYITWKSGLCRHLLANEQTMDEKVGLTNAWAYHLW